MRKEGVEIMKRHNYASGQFLIDREMICNSQQLRSRGTTICMINRRCVCVTKDGNVTSIIPSSLSWPQRYWASTDAASRVSIVDTLQRYNLQVVDALNTDDRMKQMHTDAVEQSDIFHHSRNAWHALMRPTFEQQAYL
jgi:hypothetical protein